MKNVYLEKLMHIDHVVYVVDRNKFMVLSVYIAVYIFFDSMHFHLVWKQFSKATQK